MNQAQATSALTDAVCKADVRCRVSRRRTWHVVSATLALLPSREAVMAEGVDATIERLEAAVKGKLIIGGIILLIAFFTPWFWTLLISIVVAIIVKWLVYDTEMMGLIAQAKG